MKIQNVNSNFNLSSPYKLLLFEKEYQWKEEYEQLLSVYLKLLFENT